ncbi:hypothetical protein KIF53_11120 [Chromobacterium subtsugae]|uniref:Uncharacterized protein n=1 Tax=Chromobacterium subtsugae TaxID=251747 RepID=A0ABS7FDN5_9NEIS|nr:MULTISPECIES: hypothetical protein [Chromobacterium]MBW7566874.1 hypothetical protein [Chromobacterium subtsugae]MBW8288179.1 hypothetical protein [Chromobacterium subtsugae]WSE92857.1 hypothetical protein U6115_06260 [Chromobacterium subtsugae]WVH61235.1 hypothetical protein U6151_06280 [Chromobacterium subtsugae]
MLKTILASSLSLLLLSASAMAGSDGLSVMWAMRGRMDAQLHNQPAPMVPQFNSIPSDR